MNKKVSRSFYRKISAIFTIIGLIMLASAVTGVTAYTPPYDKDACDAVLSEPAWCIAYAHYDDGEAGAECKSTLGYVEQAYGYVGVFFSPTHDCHIKVTASSTNLTYYEWSNWFAGLAYIEVWIEIRNTNTVILGSYRLYNDYRGWGATGCGNGVDVAGYNDFNNVQLSQGTTYIVDVRVMTSTTNVAQVEDWNQTESTSYLPVGSITIEYLD